jgi:hypothetical protein
MDEGDSWRWLRERRMKWRLPPSARYSQESPAGRHEKLVLIFLNFILVAAVFDWHKSF